MSQQFFLPCSCGQKIRITTSQAGEQVACACGKLLHVPTLRGIRALEPAPAELAAPQGADRRWSGWHGAIFAAGLFAALAGLAIVAFHLWHYAQYAGYSTDRSPDVIEAEIARIDGLSPEQALAEWSAMLEEGLGQPEPFPWDRAKERIAGHLWWTKLGGAVIAGGLVVALATALVGRRNDHRRRKMSTTS